MQDKDKFSGHPPAGQYPEIRVDGRFNSGQARLPKRPRRKRSWFKRLMFFIGGLLGLFALLVFALPYVLPSERIAEEISRQVRAATGWHFEVGGPISISLLPSAQFRADEVLISTDGTTPFVYTQSLRFGINLSAVFTGRVELNELTFVGPKIDLTVDETGKASWQVTEGEVGQSQSAFLQPQAEGVAPATGTDGVLRALERLQIEQMSVRNGALNYRDLRTGADVRFSNISLATSALSLDQPLSIDGALDYRDERLSLQARLEMPRAVLSGGRSNLQAGFEGDVLGASLAGAVDFGPESALAGQFAASAPSLPGLAAWLGADLPDSAAALQNVALSADVALSTQLADITGFALDIGEERLTGALRADLTGDAPVISGRVASEGLDVAALINTFGVVPENGVSVKGTMVADIQFAAAGSAVEELTSSLNARGSLGLRGGTVELAGLGSLLGESAAGTVNDITADLTINTLETPIGLTGQANWRGERFELSAQADAGGLLTKGAGGLQLAVNSSRVSGGVDGALTQSGAFDGNIRLETSSLRNLLAWLNQPIGQGGGMGPFRYSGRLALEGQSLSFNEARILLDGTSGTGSGRIAFSGKPQINAALALDVLDITPYLAGQSSATNGRGGGQSSAPAGSQWSDTPFDLSGLNLVDANISLQAQEMRWGDLRTGQAQMDIELQSGVLTADLNQLQLYQGRGAGRVMIDASQAALQMQLNFDLASVSALPLLQAVAGFGRIEGLADFSLALASFGASERSLVSNLNGETRLFFRNGAIRGVNIPQIVGALSVRTLLGWQINETQETEFSELSGSFAIQNGIARTDDIRLQGPLVRATGAGLVDLPARSLDMRFEPEIAARLPGQGNAEGLSSLGVPIVVQGPFERPRIYPDVAGILENPEAAFERLRQLGGGLAALTDDGDVLRGSVREQIQQSTGVNVEGLIEDGRVNPDRALNEGVNLLGRLLGNPESQAAGNAPITAPAAPQNLSAIPVPRPNPLRVSPSAPPLLLNPSPPAEAPQEAQNAPSGGTPDDSGPSAGAPVAAPDTPPASEPPPEEGGPIDLLNPDLSGGSNPAATEENSPPAPTTDPVEELLRGILER